MNPKKFLTIAGLFLILIGILGVTDILGTISSASFFHPPYWINYVHLIVGILALVVALWGSSRLQSGVVLFPAIIGPTIGLLGLVFGSYVANHFNIPELADPSDHIAHLIVGLLAVWSWKSRKVNNFKLSLIDFIKLVSRVRKLKAREKWSPEKIRQFQEEELKKLRQYVYQHSPFYQKFHKGLENRPLHELPVLTKKELMASWDDVVTDRSLKLKDIEHFLENVTGLEAYKEKYFTFATGGTTGVKGITIYSKNEFLEFFSSSTRLSGWTGMHFSLKERPRMTAVQSHLPWHVAGAASFIKLPIVKMLVLDSVEPVPELVRKLNDFKPHVLAGYAGNVHLLALEQIAGRLHISPKTALTTAETLKKEARKTIEKAWGIKPFEAYGSTEVGEAAAECEQHNGMHIYDDMVILEVVDNNNQPVLPGTFGSKVLATVLWNRTLPFIRYELSDHLKMAEKPCACGRPFRLIQEVQGREEQVIYLQSQSGEKARIEPDIFFDNMVLLPIDGWQVVQEKEDSITFLILDPHSEFREADFLKRIGEEIEKQGAKLPTLKIEYIKELRRTKVGKVISIQALPQKNI